MGFSPVVALLALVLLLANCGDAVVPAAATADRPATLRTMLYFLAEEGTVPLGTRREIVERTPPPWGSVARGPLEALLAGPSAEEASAGLTTAIPPGTRLISLDSWGKGGTGAVVGLSGLAAVEDALDRARVITQIVRTLVGISGSSVERVWLLEEDNRGAWTSWRAASTTVRSTTPPSAGFTSVRPALGRCPGPPRASLRVSA